MLQGLRGSFQLTGTLQEPAGRRNPRELGDMDGGLLLGQEPAQLQLCLQHPPGTGWGSLRVPRGVPPSPKAMLSRAEHQRWPRVTSARPPQYWGRGIQSGCTAPARARHG